MRTGFSDLINDSQIQADIQVETFTDESGTHKRSIVRRGRESWTEGKFIGTGAFGSVSLFTHQKPNGHAKVQAVKKITIGPELGEGYDFREELEAILTFSAEKYREFFVKCHGWYVINDSVCIVMEYLQNGELNAYTRQLGRPFPEPEVKTIISQVTEGINIIHQTGFVHRNINPRKIFIVSAGPNWKIKIGGFNIATRVGIDGSLAENAGTPGFMAPEIYGFYPPGTREDCKLKDSLSYTEKVDLWSLGVTAFYLLFHIYPFSGISDLIQHVRIGARLNFPSTPEVSQPCYEFLAGAMASGASERLSAEDAMGHRWLNDNFPNSEPKSIGSELKILPTGPSAHSDTYNDAMGMGGLDKMHEGLETRKIETRTRSQQSFPRQLAQNPVPSDSGLASITDANSTQIFSSFGTATNLPTEGTSVCPETWPADSPKSQEQVHMSNTQAPQGLYDSQTQYSRSDTSSLPPIQDRGYMAGLGKELFAAVRSFSSDQETLKHITGLLPDLLKAFALKVGYKAGTRMHLDVCFFVHKHRSRIQGFFEEMLSFETDTRDFSEKIENEQYVIDRFLRDVNCAAPPDDPEVTLPLSGPEPEDDWSFENDFDDLEPDFTPYRDFILETPAYNWLITTLQREATLTRASPDTMDEIRKTVLKALPPFHRVSRKQASQGYRGVFELDWDPLSFLIDQQSSEPPHEALKKAITLTGTENDGQATTTAEYLSQTWPSTGGFVMDLVADVVKHAGQRATATSQDGACVCLEIQDCKFIVTVSGTGDSLAEIAQQFAWLGSALRSSHIESGVASCTPFIENIRLQSESLSSKESGALSPSELFCSIKFRMEGHPSGEQLPGECWHKMFRNPVIVNGYPTLAKEMHGLGLEVPLNIMAGLTGTEQAIEIDKKIFIKGFSAMLVATKLTEGLLIWHYFYNSAGHRISYFDQSLQDVHVDQISLLHLDTHRHIVGWCSDCTYNAGAADALYDTKGTGLPRPHAGCMLDKVSLSCGKIITGGVSFSIFMRDTPPHIVRNGYVPRLRWIFTRFVVLWDEKDKRGWLVNGVSALLHLVRASLHHYSKDDFARSFRFDFSKLQNSSDRRPNSAIDVLTDETNLELEIYPGRSELSHEEEITLGKSAGESSKTQKKKKGYYLFGDLVEQHLTALEQVMEYQSHASGENGMNLKVRVRKHLEGWDFVELATDHDPQPRVATLEALGWGWVDFVRSIDAITLFGRGFGEIIRPVEFDGMCPDWKRLPSQKYYLAASVNDMEKIMKRFGNGWESPCQSLLWHCPDGAIAACPCQSRRGRGRLTGKLTRHYDPVQVFYPRSSRLISRIRGPGELEGNGAVVFGHNYSCKFRWRNNGKEGLEHGHPPSPTSIHQMTPPIQDSSSNSSIRTTPRSSASRSSRTYYSTASGTTPTSTSADPACSSQSEPFSDTAQYIPELSNTFSNASISERDRVTTRTLRREKRRLPLSR